MLSKISEPVPIQPTAHYAMGGVRVDAETAASTVPGLYAAGEVAGGMTGLDPTVNGQLTKEEIKRGEADANARLKLSPRDVPEPVARSKGPRYTPVAKRQDRPDAIAWLLKVHPELQDSQVAKLVGSTKSTVLSVKDRSHWNMQNVRPRDPVTLGLCSLKDLNDAVDRARRKAAREDAAKKKELKTQFDAVLTKLNENNETMRKAYGFSLDRNYIVEIEKAHVYMLVTEEEATKIEAAEKAAAAKPAAKK